MKIHGEIINQQNAKIMKTHRILYLVLAAVTLAACQREEADFAEDLPVRRVHFSAGEIETRTVFGEANGTSYPTLWTDQDSEVAISLNFARFRNATVIPSANYLSAIFSAEFTDEGEAPYVFYLVSPSTAARSISASRNGWNIQIPAVQTPTAQSLDEAAQILVAKSESFQEIPEHIDVLFDHLTAYGRITLKNVDKALDNAGFEEATILSVDLTSEEAFAGSWYYNVDDGTMTPKDPSYTLTLKLSDVADASLIQNLWFGCLPADMSEKSLKVRVNTDKGSVERTITFPAGRAFTAGKIATFSVNMESATVAVTEKLIPEIVYKLVKSVDELEEDDEIILLNTYNNPGYVMGATASSNGIAAIQKSASSFSVGDDGYIRLAEETTVSKDMYVYSKADNVFGFVDPNYGALALTGSSSWFSSNYYLGWNESSLTEWTVSIDKNGAATLSTQASTSSWSSSTTNYYIHYSNNYFNATTSSGTVSIYKRTIIYSSEINTDPMSDPNDPILEQEEYGAYLSDSNAQVYTRHGDQLSREYQADEVAFAIITPAEGKVLEFSGIPAGATKEDTFTLTVCRYVNEQVAYIRKFGVIVVKEEGPKLWLSTGAGEGFIIKK